MTDKKKKYDLEDRTFLFAKKVRSFCKKLPTKWLTIRILFFS